MKDKYYPGRELYLINFGYDCHGRSMTLEAQNFHANEKNTAPLGVMRKNTGVLF